MARLRLISHKLCPYVQRAVIALTEKGVAFERIDVDLANKPEWFLRVSPLGKTPVLQVDEVTFQAKATHLEQRFARLEARVVASPWFDGESFSLVDVVFGPVFLYFD